MDQTAPAPVLADRHAGAAGLVLFSSIHFFLFKTAYGQTVGITDRRPHDIGAGHRGASMGPEALRVANLADRLRKRGVEVVDRGNLQGPVNPWLPPVDGYRHLEQAVAWNHSVYQAVHAELELARLPIMLGGDHSLALGSITAVARHCREQAKSCGCSGWMHMPISTPPRSRLREISMACR